MKFLTLFCIATLAFCYTSCQLCTSQKRAYRVYEHTHHLEDFYCHTPFRINKSGKNPKLEIDVSSPTYTPRNKYTKKAKLNQRARRIEWEHIMPAQNFGKHLPCWKNGGRKACAKDPTFQQRKPIYTT